MNIRKMFAIVITAVGILSAQSMKTAVTNPVKAKRCLEEGKRLEAKAAPEGSGSQKLFEKALAKYLCAANAGNSEGAMLAASLSLSGQASRLPDDTIRHLYRLAINDGKSEAFVGLADFECGDGGFNECINNRNEALRCLLDAERASVDVSFEIALLLRDPDFPGSDSSRAFACNKRIGGKKWPKIRDEYLDKSPLLDTTKRCEIY